MSQPAPTANCSRSTSLPPAELGQPSNIDGLKADLVYYKCSGAYLAEFSRAIDEANSYVIQRAKNVSKPALVLDIDETSLSNWEEIQADDFGFIPEGSCDGLPKGPCGDDAWERLARATAIEPTLNLFKIASDHNVAVFFITGRKNKFREATEKNLRAAQYIGWTDLLLKPDNDTSTVQQFKTAMRKQIEDKGYTIIANVGDQYSDLNGGHAERTFKVPNPFYFIP